MKEYGSFKEYLKSLLDKEPDAEILYEQCKVNVKEKKSKSCINCIAGYKMHCPDYKKAVKE